MKRENLGAARHHAATIAGFLEAIFWCSPSSEFLEREATAEFAKLADALGYEIKRKEAAE